MRLLKYLFVLITLSNCASIPDVYLCRARSSSSGFCTKTITNQDVIVDDVTLLNGKTWIDLKIDAIIMPPESWAEIKKFILKKCAQDNNCSNNLNVWASKIDNLAP